jgi:D-alanine-D-alanine ligase-like ATP-grasp enzyme
MRYLFYSTSSNNYNEEDWISYSFPLCKDETEKLALLYPEHTFIIATQKPGTFLLDNAALPDNLKAENLEYHLINFDDEKEIAQFLSDLKPDIAAAASFYLQPFDWFTVKDSLVAATLRQKGIRTVCHSRRTALTCFDKWQTHSLLQKLNLNTPECIFVDHALFINAGNRPVIKSNVYKTAVLEELRNLHYPVIIKDTTGLSSLGTDVLNSYGELYDWLKSKKFTGDRIVEEYIRGLHLGTEIHALSAGKGFKYKIMPPLLFSTNKYGITSPKQSIKCGPVTSRRFRLFALNRMLKKLSQECRFEGITQVDLIFDGKKWFIIEINPRLSGMSETYGCMQNKTVIKTLAECAGIKNKKKTAIRDRLLKKNNFILNIKYPLLDEAKLKKAAELDFVKKVHQTQNLAARQLREKGYCEIIITGKNKKELKKNLHLLKDSLPEQTEEIFFEKAEALIKEL